MRIPPTIKLRIFHLDEDMPLADADELMVSVIWRTAPVSAGLPKLQTLRIFCPSQALSYGQTEALRSYRAAEPANFLYLLQRRNQNVEAGMEVNGIKMEHIKKLVIAFDKYTPQQLDELRELVEEVVEMTAENEFCEVEVSN